MPDVKLLYFCIKEIFERSLFTEEIGMDFAIVSSNKKKIPTPKLLVAAIIWFSVIEDKNRPVDTNALDINYNPKKFPTIIPKLGLVKKEIIKV